MFLASVAHIAGGVAIAQMLRKPIQFISDKIIPYEKSGEAKAAVHRGMINYETQQKMEELRHKNQMELNRQNNLSQARLSRNSTIAAQNFRFICRGRNYNRIVIKHKRDCFVIIACYACNMEGGKDK